MLASKEERWGDEPILRRGDVVFFWGDTQLDWTISGHTDRAEVRFRSSKGDQWWDGMVVTRTHVGHLSRCGMGAGQ